VITKVKTVDEFLGTLAEEERAVFARVRALFNARKEVVESMDFKMPSYKVGGRMVGAFNKQKNYLCLYVNPTAVDPHRKALAKLDCGKSCIRFKKAADLPLDVAAKIIAAATELAARG